jgi:hypothetical protein
MARLFFISNFIWELREGWGDNCFVNGVHSWGGFFLLAKRGRKWSEFHRESSSLMKVCSWSSRKYKEVTRLSPSSPKVKEGCSFVSTELIRSFACPDIHLLAHSCSFLLWGTPWLLLSSWSQLTLIFPSHSSPLSVPVTTHPYLSQSRLIFSHMRKIHV